MMSEQTPTSQITSHARKAKASRRTAGRKCARCGEARPQALLLKRTPVICAACDRKRRGKAIADAHHVAGQANSPITIPVPVNDHRAVLSEAQYEWPPETWDNADGSPLLAAAGGLRGFVDIVIYLMEKFVTSGVALLELLDRYLRERFGDGWWIGTAVAAWAPVRPC